MRSSQEIIFNSKISCFIVIVTAQHVFNIQEGKLTMLPDFGTSRNLSRV